ncbi:MAG: SdpI family protein [Candidatus Diapherotrites archaeon]|nr:SdpI family protein [Candidatus Diapherotrites archaeon]
MKIKNIVFIVLILSIIAFGVTFYFLESLPEQIASHWNAEGTVNGYLPKIGIFLIPVLILIIGLILIYLPKLDPKKENIQEFENYYHNFIIIFLLFFAGIHAFVLAWNLGTPISISLIMPIGLGVLFYYVGILCQHSKQNWFIGIRTPWTLSNEQVWNQTHKLAGKGFKLTGLLSILSILIPIYSIWIILISILGTALVLIIYSYLEYKKIVSKNN